jgi:hypothetical protein
MIIVIYQAGVGGVSDSELGAKNGFLGVLALRIYACTLHPIMDFSPFQNDSTMRSWIDSTSLEYCPRCLSLILFATAWTEHLHLFTLCKCHAFPMAATRKRDKSQYGQLT